SGATLAGPRGTAPGAAAIGSAAAARGLVRLPRKRTVGSGAPRLALEPLLHRARAARGRLVPRLLRGLLAASIGKRHARAARLGQADRDRLLGASRAVLSFADVVHLLLHELARRRARALTFAKIALCAPDGALFWHGVSFR